MSTEAINVAEEIVPYFLLGTLVACVAILVDTENLTILVFLPYALDFIVQASADSGWKHSSNSK